jgi:DNA (cytosine-5)-methyltransferase 1
VTGANRGELAFIAAQFGEREGPGAARARHRRNRRRRSAPRATSTWSRRRPEYDILFRMLEPHELAAAMGFDSEEAKYEFAGTKTEKIKQIGNAVSVAKMKACVGAIMAAERGARMKHPMVDFLFYLLAALMVLAMLPIGIGLMIAFTIADCAVRMSGRLWRAGR